MDARQDLPAIKNLIKQHPRQLMQSPLPKLADFFVVEEQGRIVGCCALEIYSRRIGEIRSLVVARQFRHRGLATRLIQTCLKKARSQRIYEVLGITSAVKLFKKNGFRTFHEEKYALLKVLGK